MDGFEIIDKLGDGAYSIVYKVKRKEDSNIYALKKVINLNNGQSVRLRIFDTAGQERFKSISLNFIKKADGILLLYDITNRSSFESVNKWIESIHDVAEEKVTILLIGNKCDLEKERVITKEEGEAKTS